MVPAGVYTDRLHDYLALDDNPGAVTHVERALAPLAAHYQLVVFDCPPGDRLLLDSALSAAHYVVAPTQSDDGSILGLERMARRLANTRARYNPALELLGVAVFNIAATDKRIVSEVREQLVEALGGYAPVFDSFIRNARKASRDMRSRGLLAYEYQEAADNAEPWYRSMKNPSELEGVTARLTYAANAAALASDYVALSAEILRRYQERLGTAQMMAIA